MEIPQISQVVGNGNWLFLRDFNEVLDVSKRCGLGEKFDVGPVDFRSANEASALFEVHMRGGMYTWTN